MLIEVTTEYGIAKFDVKTLSEGLKRFKKDSQCPHPKYQQTTDKPDQNGVSTTTCGKCGKSWLS